MELCGNTAPYTHKSFCRKVLSLLEQPQNPGSKASLGENAFDKFVVSDLLRWMPDQQGYLAPLASSKAGEVRRRFGMSAFTLAHFCCFWGGMTRPMRDAWRAAPAYELLGSLPRLRNAAKPGVEACMPGPQTIAKYFLSD